MSQHPHTTTPRLHAGLPALALCLWAGGVHGQTLYGSVHANGRPVSGVVLELACPGFGAPAAQQREARTDGLGVFTLRAPAPARSRCELRAQGRGAAPLVVFLSATTLKIEYELDAQGNLRER